MDARPPRQLPLRVGHESDARGVAIARSAGGAPGARPGLGADPVEALGEWRDVGHGACGINLPGRLVVLPLHADEGPRRHALPVDVGALEVALATPDHWTDEVRQEGPIG